ncbi:RsmB/NOP family class I SAM-dependent RNA methyltransferase [Roseomonas sp. CECT 9278]|uniref:RsmB/NOP family class I SAM-dependent RNA methyltransferase n=1 Tax=Roseomonas sp. CECT 9278 TaxID=2845823 RepID=UPI001E4F2359|nr:transcription antitermination factor NusB [Roseomonas sp. CECT 9278]CAH0297156.1 Ribosomal RNA small subunit methyltransferase B [Roseomonas sp. CECT 9278]
MTPPPGLPTRRAARDLLDATLEQRKPLEEALDALPGRLDPRDRAAAHRIAAMVLRRLGSIDEVLSPRLRKEPPPPARHALRIGAAELLLLDTPPHAAVATAVALAPKAFAGLVNAVLRKVAAEGPAALEGLDAPRLDTPGWLWSAWHAAYGPAVRAIAEAHRGPAPLDLTPAPGAEPPAGAEILPTGTWRMAPGTRVTDLPGFAEGRFWVQDAAAALPALLLAPRPGERIADLCAAPGGKTAQLAAAGAEVTAVERDAGRLARLTENLARLHLPATIVQADAAAWAPPAPFDAILLDAPCTATGTIRRHPDVAHAKRARDVPAAAQAQARLIAAAAKMLKPGGRLVFATCSLQPEEGEAHLARAAALGLEPMPWTTADLPGLPEAITPAGCLRTRPDLWAARGGMDGFFAARFRRAG